MFSEIHIMPPQLSLPGWRLLTGLEVLWLDVFKEDISYRDLRGFYQLKKQAGLSVTYFATWGVHGNLVRLDPLLKNGDMGGLWLKASGGGVYQHGMKLCKFETSSMKIDFCRHHLV